MHDENETLSPRAGAGEGSGMSTQPRRVRLDWMVGPTARPDEAPARMVPARVPGAVQLDWERAEGWEPWHRGENFRRYDWMEDSHWVYAARFGRAELGGGGRPFLVSGGIDYKYEIILNGTRLLEREGMFSPVDLDLSEALREDNLLEVLVHPAPKRPGAPPGRSEADHSCKPAVSYGWDFHPRLIPLGIWDETFLELRGEDRILSCREDYELEAGLGAVRLEALVERAGQGTASIAWSLRGPGGELAASATVPAAAGSTQLDMSLESPELWWPNGQGKQAFYVSHIALIDDAGRELDCRERRIGFRRVRLVMNEGAWDEPSAFPKTRSDCPATLEINGRRVFCKGSNWVPPGVFPGVEGAESYRPLLELARDAHMNLIRCWGGGPVNKDSFYGLCDELGLMVWQEFPLACNDYPDDPAYLAVLDRESRAIIGRLGWHACLVMWCGGNELFNFWSGMTDQSLALRLLDRNCYELDPRTPFLMTSPLSGMAHGHYHNVAEGGIESLRLVQAARNTAYTEFGSPGPAPAALLRGLMGEEAFSSPEPGTIWESRHAFGAWTPADTWLRRSEAEFYFGAVGDTDDLIAKCAFIQALSVRALFEEMRRQWPRCSMALNWCLNEPWLTAANNSLVSWPAVPKPAMAAVREALRPVQASLRTETLRFEAGGDFRGELWLLNDSDGELPAGRMELIMTIGGARATVMLWEHGPVKPRSHLRGPAFSRPLPSDAVPIFEAILACAGRPEWNSSYRLVARRPQGESAESDAAGAGEGAARPRPLNISREPR